jgi:hypothetical protein
MAREDQQRPVGCGESEWADRWEMAFGAGREYEPPEPTERDLREVVEVVEEGEDTVLRFGDGYDVCLPPSDAYVWYTDNRGEYSKRRFQVGDYYDMVEEEGVPPEAATA